MAKETTGSAGKKKAGPPVLAGRHPGAPSAERKQALETYSAALKLLSEGKFEKAKATFGKLDSSTPLEIMERVRVHLTVCDRELRSRKLEFQTPQEESDYAISLLNQGLYPDARMHFDAVLQRQKDADYAMYGLAVLHSMIEQSDEALDQLERAIALNPANRLYARGDGDFQNIMDDPRFTELLYPEVQ